MGVTGKGTRGEVMHLTDKQVAALTRRKQPAAQARVLLDAGIPFRMVDKRPVVRSDYDAQNHRPPEPQLRLNRAL